MMVLPAIDILDGKCVRLMQGNYNQVTEYSDNPISIAKMFITKGFKYLHIIDLNGAKDGGFINRNVIENLIALPNVKIQLGGGIRNIDDIQERVDLGIDEINISTLALTKPEIIKQAIKKYGSDRIVISVDINKSKIMLRGWRGYGAKDKYLFMDDMIERGITKFICTDILQDGTLEKPNFSLYRELRQYYPSISITAAGGVSNVDDIVRLDSIGVNYAIIGRALYEKRITLEELTGYKLC